MIRNRLLIGLVTSLALGPFAAVGAGTAGPGFALDARVTLDAYRAAVEARLDGVLAATRTLAATEEARSGQWARMREPLAVLASTVEGQAAVWFARPDGSYFTLEKGATGATLRERAYFPALLAGRDVVGALVVSKSTKQRALIFVFPSDVGSSTLSEAVKTMLSSPEGVVNYRYAGSEKTALFQRSERIGWVFVLGRLAQE